MFVHARKCHSVVFLLAFVTIAGFAPTAQAAITSDATIQVLDQLDVFSRTQLKRSTEAPIRLEDLDSSSTSTLTSCQNGRNGLVCLDGQIIRNWKAPKTLTAPPTALNRDAGAALFSCQDDALALDTRSGPCLSATVDVSGDIWLAARKSNTSHNLIQVKRRVGATCTADGASAFSGRIRNVAYTGTQYTSYCFTLRRTGRPQLLDISAFDGELAGSYRGRGILGVEVRKNIVFFPSDGSPVVDVLSGTRLNLNGGEDVQSAALLQRELPLVPPATTPTVQTFVVFTTSTGRVLWRNANDTSGARATQIASAAGATLPAPGVSFPIGAACDATGTANFYELRISDTTGRFFISNRNYCRVFAAGPVFNSLDPVISGLGDIDTVDTSLAAFKPEGLSVAPGIAVNLAECADPAMGCDFIPDGVDPSATQQIAAAKMLNVTLAPNSPTGLIVFQIRNIPDCRKIPTAAECVAGTVIDVPGKGKYLNVTPMLPQQIKDLFDASGRKPFGLPPMLISPRYEAQPLNGDTFDALFGVTDPEVVFRKSFTAQFDVGDANLTGASLGCGLDERLAPAYIQPAPLPFQQWDIATVVSERFGSVGGPTGTMVDNLATPGVDETEHVDMLTNKGCFNPTQSAGTRWSLYAFNLRLAPVDPVGVTYAKPRLYLGNLLKSLYMDLQDVQQRLVCQSADGVGNTVDANGNTILAAAPPLSGGACTNLQSNWDGTMDKLFKCINAAVDPKVSQLDQNCGAFDAQFPGYRTYAAGLTPTGPDPANRVGEITSRLDVINYLFYGHFLKAPLDQ